MNGPIAYGSLALLALGGAPHCAAMCGPLALWAAGTARGREAWARALLQALGRALGYALLGFGAALLVQRALASAPWRHAQFASAVLVALVLAIAALRALGFAPRAARLPAFVERACGSAGASLRALGPRRGAFGAGLFNAFLPCGLSWSALALASQAEPLAALGASATFGALTALGPLCVLAGQRWFAARADRSARYATAFVLATGASLCAWRGLAAWNETSAPCCEASATTAP